MPDAIWKGGGSDATKYDATDNWVGAAIPTTGDDVYIRPHPDTGVSHPILTGLAQGSVAIASFQTDDTYDANIGDSEAGHYLEIKTTGKILHWGSGIACIKAATAAYSLLELRVPIGSAGALWFKGGTTTNRGTKAVLTNGELRWVEGDVITLIQSYAVESQAGSSLYWLGGAVSGTGARAWILGGSLRQTGGSLTPATVIDGNIVVQDGVFDISDVRGGFVDYRSPETVSALRVWNDAEVDVSRDNRKKTISYALVAGSGLLNANNPNITWTTGINTIGPARVHHPKSRSLAFA